MTTHTAPVVGVPVAPPLPADLEALLRRMRFPYMRAQAPDILATARAQRWDPAEVIKALLTEEITGRERSALRTRRTAAGFPTGKTFDAWQESASSIPQPTQQALRTLEWVGRKENLVAGHLAPGRRSSSKPSANTPSNKASASPGSPSKTSGSCSAGTGPTTP